MLFNFYFRSESFCFVDVVRKVLSISVGVECQYFKKKREREGKKNENKGGKKKGRRKGVGKKRENVFMFLSYRYDFN